MQYQGGKSMAKIYLHNGSTIEMITSNNKNIRSKRVLLTKIINSDGTVDYCFDREILNDIIRPFGTDDKEGVLNE